MNTASTTTATTHTLDVPGACLHYELRGDGPLVVLVGAPMDALSFAPAAELLASDRTVLTTDPRGIHRSSVTDRDADSTPELRADDLARLLVHLDGGPAAVFGSSGGAVTALALAQARPELVHTVIAHEPPLIELLSDRAELRAGTEDIATIGIAGDRVGAWRKFMAQANITLPDEIFEMMFGAAPEPQQAADEQFWFAREFRPSTYWRPDFDVLRNVPTRIVAGIGRDSAGELCERTTAALANELALEPTYFAGGHISFVDDPAAFVEDLRQVLSRSETLR